MTSITETENRPTTFLQKKKIRLTTEAHAHADADADRNRDAYSPMQSPTDETVKGATLMPEPVRGL
jgi:hypothetical protein